MFQYYYSQCGGAGVEVKITPDNSPQKSEDSSPNHITIKRLDCSSAQRQYGNFLSVHHYGRASLASVSGKLLHHGYYII